MNKKLLTNKLILQIFVLIFAIIIFSLGIVECLYCTINLPDYVLVEHYGTNGYYVRTYYDGESSMNYLHISGSYWGGIITIVVSLILMISASIKLANVAIILKNTNSSAQTQNAQSSTKSSQNNPNSVNEQLLKAQNMLKNGILTEEEYEAFRKKLLANYYN